MDLDMGETLSGKVSAGPMAFVSQDGGRTITEEPEYSGAVMILSDIDSGNDMCFIVNGQKKYYRQPRYQFTRSEWQNHKDSKNGKNGWNSVKYDDYPHDSKKQEDNYVKKERSEDYVKDKRSNDYVKDDKGKIVICYGCGELNHFEKDCRAKKTTKETVNDKTKSDEIAYYASKLKIAVQKKEFDDKLTEIEDEEHERKAKNVAFFVKGTQESDGEEQYWSTGSDDEEMMHPTHGKSMEEILKEEKELAEEEAKWNAHCAEVTADFHARSGRASLKDQSEGDFVLPGGKPRGLGEGMIRQGGSGSGRNEVGMAATSRDGTMNRVMGDSL